MRLIGRETVAHYDCGHMEPESVPEGETADVVIAHRSVVVKPKSGGKFEHRTKYEWRFVRNVRNNKLGYVRTAGPIGWVDAVT